MPAMLVKNLDHQLTLHLLRFSGGRLDDRLGLGVLMTVEVVADLDLEIRLGP